MSRTITTGLQADSGFNARFPCVCTPPSIFLWHSWCRKNLIRSIAPDPIRTEIVFRKNTPIWITDTWGLSTESERQQKRSWKGLETHRTLLDTSRSPSCQSADGRRRASGKSRPRAPVLFYGRARRTSGAGGVRAGVGGAFPKDHRKTYGVTKLTTLFVEYHE